MWLSMGQRENTNDAAVKDAQIKQSGEECVKDMGQRRNTKDAAVMDALTKPLKVEFVLSMGQSLNDAAVMDEQIKLGREECA